MNIGKLKKKLTNYAGKLSKKELTELLANVKSLIREGKPEAFSMSKFEETHLEEEFRDYKKRFPIE